MLEQMIGQLPEPWRELAALLLAPIIWIPGLQSLLIDYFVETPFGWTATAKFGLLAFPALLGLTAVWCTQLSLYTLPFRSRRILFVSSLLLTWWGAALAVWMYWVGLVRVILVLITFMALAVKLAFEATLRLVFRLGWAGPRPREAFRPGVPWVAVGLLVFWCALEATVFTRAVLPTLAEELVDLAGHDRLPRAAGTLLWVFLFLLIMGSFVCIQVLVEAVKKRAFTLIVLSVLVELFVMSFEVVFLYRGIAEAIMPWMIQHTGDTFQPGAWFTLTVARFGWTGVRGMGWFLFGQYGTPPLVHILSRQPLPRREGSASLAAPRPARRQAPSAGFTGHLAWVHDQGYTLLAYLCLPVLHVIAAALNFIMVVVAARPLFSLPFKGLAEALESRSPVQE